MPNRGKRVLYLGAFFTAPLVVGCSDTLPSARPGSADVLDAAPDSASRMDSGIDSARTAEASTEGGRDAGVDASVDREKDAASPDATPEAHPDGRVDGTDPHFARIGKYTTTIAASLDPADVYYPDPPDLQSGRYAFPVVLLLQGAKVARQFYSGVSAAVAGYGFVVVVPDHESDNIGGRGLYAELREVADVLAHMQSEATNSTSPVRGVLDTAHLALMGHSYGGASGLSGMANSCFPPIPLCTFQRPPELAGGAFYGTHLVAFGAAPALDTGGLPVLLLQGDRDGKALPSDAKTTFDQIQKRPKGILSLKGANHYGVTDVDNPPGADAELSAQTLDHATGVAALGRWTGVFFRAFLLGDTRARAALETAPQLDGNVDLSLEQ